MNMITIKALQGSDEWLAERAMPNTYTASEAPAMKGESKHDTRTALLYQKFTGSTKDVSPQLQALFDKGHKAEAAARPFVAASIGADLSPTTGFITVDGMRLLASFDGYDMLENVIWENKLFNADLADAVRAGQLDPHYYWQLEQQLLVSGADKAYFTTSDGTPENTVGMWYEAVPGRREQLIAGWKQFAEDLENYVHTETADAPKAEVSIELPALFIQAKGEITDSNMQEFGAALTKRLVEVRAIVLDTDQDFSNAKESAAMLRRRAKEMKTTKEAMLAQTLTIGEASRMMDAWSKDMNETALQLEKDVDKKDLEKKAAMVSGGRAKLVDYIAAINTRLGGKFMPPMGCETFPGTIFSDAIKSKRKYSAMQDGVDTALANAKVKADGIAATIEANQTSQSDVPHLFPDFATHCTKTTEDFAALLFQRTTQEANRKEAERVAAEAATAAAVAAAVAATIESERKAGEARAAAEAERIRKEEADKITAQNQTQYEDQRGKTADATHAVQQATELPQAPAAITPPTPEHSSALAASDDDPVIDRFVGLLPMTDIEKRAHRLTIIKWEKYRVALLMKAAA